MKKDNELAYNLIQKIISSERDCVKGLVLSGVWREILIGGVKGLNIETKEYTEEELQGLPDEKLVQLAKEENKLARKVIYFRYQAMPGYIIKKHGYKINGLDYEDLMQYGFLYMSSAIANFDKTRNCSYKTFLYCVLKKSYLALMCNRKINKSNEIAISDIFEDNDVSSIDYLKKFDANNSYEKAELEELLSGLRNNLTEIEYNCVVSRYYGKSYKSISNIFGYSTKQIDNTLQNIKRTKASILK